MNFQDKWGTLPYGWVWRTLGIDVCLVEEVYGVPCAFIFAVPVVLPQEEE